MQAAPEPNHEWEVLLEQQKHRIQELEDALAEAGVRQQAEVAALQNHHAKQLAEARLQLTALGTPAGSDVPQAEVTFPVAVQSRATTRNGTTQTDTMTGNSLEELEKEKAQLEASLVELDQQNQEALAKLLSVKTKLEVENREQAGALRKLQDQLNRHDAKACQATQTETSLPEERSPKHSLAVCQASQTETQLPEERNPDHSLAACHASLQAGPQEPENVPANDKDKEKHEVHCLTEAEESLRARLEQAERKCSRLEQELSNRSAQKDELEKRLEQAVIQPGERQEADGAAALETGGVKEEQLRRLEADKDRILAVLNEKSRESSSLKAEVHRLLSVVAQERQAVVQLRREKEEMASASIRQDDSELAREALQNLSRLVRDRELEVEAQKQKNSTLLQLLRQCSPVDSNQLRELLEEREALSRQLAASEEQRVQAAASLEQAKGELDDARAELDRITVEFGVLRLERDSQLQQLEEKRAAIASAREEALALRQRLADMEKRYQDLQDHQNRTAIEQASECNGPVTAGGDDGGRLSPEGDSEPVPESGKLSMEAWHWQRQSQKLQSQVQELQLKEMKQHKELERLRGHLIQMEETYTEEALQAEAREQSLRARLLKLEDWARVSETAAHSATEQASQQVGSLAQQLAAAQSSRLAVEEELRLAKASLNNLQMVLDHFQTEKDREIQLVRSSYQSQLALEKEKSQQLVDLIAQKQEQLEGNRDALEAATRLSQQLDRREEFIAALKQQVAEREAELERVRQEVCVVRSTTEGKVDKQVMKSLVLGYFSTPQGQRAEVVRLLARVLDFSREEMDKAGISLGNQEGSLQVSWISGFFRRSGRGTSDGDRKSVV